VAPDVSARRVSSVAEYPFTGEGTQTAAPAPAA